MFIPNQKILIGLPPSNLLKRHAERVLNLMRDAVRNQTPFSMGEGLGMRILVLFWAMQKRKRTRMEVRILIEYKNNT